MYESTAQGFVEVLQRLGVPAWTAVSPTCDILYCVYVTAPLSAVTVCFEVEEDVLDFICIYLDVLKERAQKEEAENGSKE